MSFRGLQKKVAFLLEIEFSNDLLKNTDCFEVCL